MTAPKKPSVSFFKGLSFKYFSSSITIPYFLSITDFGKSLKFEFSNKNFSTCNSFSSSNKLHVAYINKPFFLHNLDADMLSTIN